VTEEIRDGFIQDIQQKILIEGFPPSVERIGGHQTLETHKTCSPRSNRIEQLLKINLNLNNKSSSYPNARGKTQFWRGHEAGADLFSAFQVGVMPSLTALPPANSPKCRRAPPSLNEGIAEYLALGVLRRMTQHETQTTRHWSEVFGRSKADSERIRMITDLRFFSLPGTSLQIWWLPYHQEANPRDGILDGGVDGSMWGVSLLTTLNRISFE